MTYDTVSTIKEAIIYLISKGEEFDDPNVLGKTMRTHKFVGCLGTVFFDSSSNSRANAPLLIQQLYYNNTLNSTLTINIAVLDRYSAQLITIINPYEWPTGTAPPNFLPYSPCPFDDFQVISSQSGKAILYAICALFFVVALASVVYAEKRFPNEIKQITEESIISFEDMIFFAYFPFQFFQFITMGPDQGAYHYLVNGFEVLISMDFSIYFNITFDAFWNFHYGVLVATAIFILMMIFYLNQIDTRCAGLWIVHKIDVFSFMIISIIGHIGFLPLFSMLMNIFLCYQGISDQVTDSYLFQDCTTFCYTGKHLGIVIITAIITICALPAFILGRPFLEEIQYNLVVRTNASYLHVLSIFQILLVIFNKTLKNENQTVHGIIVVVILIILLIVTKIMKPYNYERAYISQQLSIILSIWAIGITTIFRNYNAIVAWVLVEFLGIFFILLVGLLYLQRYRQFLITGVGADISTLFLFQFCKNYEKYILKPSSLQFSRSQFKYEIPESQ